MLIARCVTRPDALRVILDMNFRLMGSIAPKYNVSKVSSLMGSLVSVLLEHTMQIIHVYHALRQIVSNAMPINASFVNQAISLLSESAKNANRTVTDATQQPTADYARMVFT